MDVWKTIGELIAKGLSPEIRQMISKLLDDWGKTAAGTKTPFDDLIIQLLKALLGF